MFEIIFALKAALFSNIWARTFGLVILGMLIMWSIITAWERFRESDSLPCKVVGFFVFAVILSEVLVLTIALWSR